MTARVSCVITSHDNGAWLPAAIESVLGQSRRPDEIIVADDASSDGSPDLIRSLAAAHPCIRPILRETNLGVATNRDLAVREAAGELVTTLDGDDLYYPDKVAHELAALNDANDATVAYSDMVDLAPDGAEIARIGFAQLTGLARPDLVRYLVDRAGRLPRDLMMPKVLFLRVGGFRRDLALYEDWDLKLRLARVADWRRAATCGVGYRRHDRGLASADGLRHLETQLQVVFGNRPWLEEVLGPAGFANAIARRVTPVGAAPVSNGSCRPDPGLSSEMLVARAQQAYRGQAFDTAAAHLEEAMRRDPQARRHAVALAHSLVLATPWAKLSSFLPPETNHLATSGWLNALFRGEPVDASSRPIPWYTYPAIAFVEQVTTGAPRVFEWGAGNSTSWWAGRAARVVSVEHDRVWHDKVAARVPDHVELRRRSVGDGYVEELAKEPPGTFDVVVIDGEARNDCARLAASHADPAGLIVFDNSDRRAFRDGLVHLTAAGWRRLDFFGLIPSYLYYNCTSIFFRDDAILARAPLPPDVISCLGPTCSQTLGQ